jgi:hypothetical protein
MKPETAAMLDRIVIACFIGTWIVLGIIGVYFYLSKNVAFKRKWYPRFVILTGVLFVFFSTTIMAFSVRSLELLVVVIVMVPFTLLIAYLNIKMTKFCDECGATLLNQNWFVAMRFCPKCGAELDAKA